MKYRFIYILVLLFAFNAQAFEPTTGLVCQNSNNTVYMEFLFKNDRKDDFADAYKRINDKFIQIGKVVGQKPSSFMLWEDKYAYLGVDFAWHLDKVTKILKPIILSESIIKLDKMPEMLSCRSKSFWY
jgi:hypothetical protein